MAISFTEVMEVKNFLLHQHIIVSEEWTEACISFVKHEQGHEVSLQNLKKIVHQQWLVADLEEIACSSLPDNLPTVQKTTLSNCFALQVQGIRDISRPAYAQLKQLDSSISSNEEYSSVPAASVPVWEAKPTRMLMLNLTDGCTQIQGMEYRPINFLSPNLAPGIKVLIKGPIDCRFGVLLLTPDNISVLGGEVESKLQQFSRENILKELLQIQSDDDNQTEFTSNSGLTNNNRQLENFGTSSTNYPDITHQNETLPSTSRQQPSGSSRTVRNFERSNEDILDLFEGDDDFEQNIDYGKLDEIENSQRPVKELTNPTRIDDEYDIWQEDEDVIQDMMEFQDRNPDFEMPFELDEGTNSRNKKDQVGLNDVFTYLSTATNNPSPDCVITIKGFIITVLSKLECTPSKGWSLAVKINDGTATVNASIHDKVLEDIIGVSAQDMVKKQAVAAKDMEVRREVMQTISKCKITLQNYNCLMDVKFTPGERPCIVKCSPVSKLQIQQLLETVRSSF